MMTYQQLPHCSLEDLKKLDATELKRLHEEANSAFKRAKACKEWIDSALHKKYGTLASQLRQAQDKDTGVVQFPDGQLLVNCDLPKKVEWDQSRLKTLALKIARNGEEPSEFIDITYKVAERKYTAWPDFLKKQFEPARTLKSGKPTYQFKEIER